ncbi:GAF domain-containing protein [Candidatus Symbiobacter mobilis]|nr:GAF domain-containing protein [Candidatus Symbiobacter mobilis]
MLQLYAAMVECGQTIIRSRSRGVLFGDVCRHLVDAGGMRAAWVGIWNPLEHRIWPTARYGKGLGYLQALSLGGKVGVHLGGSLAEQAIARNELVWSDDVTTDPGMESLRELASPLQWRSALVVPLQLGGAAWGVLNVYAEQGKAFDAGVRSLFEQLSANISHALDIFENDAQRREAEFALQESEVRYNALFASSCMPLIVLDPKSGRIVDANIRALDFYGWNHAGFTSMCVAQIYVCDPETAMRELHEAAECTFVSLEHRHRLHSGEVRDVEIFSSPIHIDGGKFLIWAVHDVSERKRLHAKMRSAQALTQRFIDHLPGAAFVKDKDLRLIVVNRHLGTMLGAEPHTLVGKTAYDLFPPEFAHNATHFDQEVLADGKSRTMDEFFEGRHAETTLFVMEDDTGERFLGGLSIDVTDPGRIRERTRGLLQLNEFASKMDEPAFLLQGLESAQSLTSSQIGFLHFVSADQQHYEMAVWTASTRNFCSADYPTHGSLHTAGVWADCLRQACPVIYNDYSTVPHKHGLPEGHPALNRFITVPIMEDGLARILIGVGNKRNAYDQIDTDTLLLVGNGMWRIIGRMRAERALQQRLQEMSALYRDLAEAQSQLLQSEKLASIGQLAAGVAHEINNPIGFIKSNLGSLADYVAKLLDIAKAYAHTEDELEAQGIHSPAFEELRRRKAEADFDFLLTDLPELIEESREGVERVGKIVMDLKNFARVGDSDFGWADIHAGLESTINVVWNELKYKADVVREYGELPLVFCVASQINQVFMNLLINAAQAMTTRGTITVRTGAVGDEVWIEVQDTGCGIDLAKQARIFDPFFTTKPVGQGTGLGLSIAMNIAKQHQGSLTVQSQPGEGTVFRMTLPVCPVTGNPPQ